MGDNFREIPNTRHVPQPNYVQNLNGREYIPNTKPDRTAGSGFRRIRYSTIPNTTDPILQAIERLNGGGSDYPNGNGGNRRDGETGYLSELARM
jgi:hypothetical protein